MGLAIADDGWRLPDALWARMQTLLPPRKPHPLGCHRPRVDDRCAMNGILFVLRTGMQWNALSATGICSCSSAYRRFREWLDAGVFEAFWQQGLLHYDQMKGIDWSWLAMDGTMTKAPLGGEKNRAQSYGSRQRRRQAQPADGGKRPAAGCGRRRGQPARHEAGAEHLGAHRSDPPGAHRGPSSGSLSGSGI